MRRRPASSCSSGSPAQLDEDEQDRRWSPTSSTPTRGRAGCAKPKCASRPRSVDGLIFMRRSCGHFCPSSAAAGAGHDHPVAGRADRRRFCKATGARALPRAGS